MKFKMYMTQTWTYTTEIEASCKEEAYEIAGDIATEISPREDDVDMRFGEEYIEIEEMKGE